MKIHIWYRSGPGAEFFFYNGFLKWRDNIRIQMLDDTYSIYTYI